MTLKKANIAHEETDFAKYSNAELADAFVFPANESVTDEEKVQDQAFWSDRRKQFESRTAEQKVYDKLLQLKFQLDDYITSDKYDELTKFGYFLNEYVNRQEKKDKQFASEVNITSAVLSQYLNSHRKPTEKFIIRLEIHSNGMIPAISWFKLLQKEKEYEIITDNMIRTEESKHVKNRLEFSF